MTSSYTYTSSAGASIFDVFAEDSLRSSLKPAWNYLLKFLTQKYPNYLLDILKYTDEIFYVILFVLEEYNLRNRCASMTEAFYDLKRESTSNSFMFRHAKSISLVSLVLLPYIQDKLENRFEKSKERILRGDTNINDFDKFVYKWYPFFVSFSKWLRMLNYILYLFRYTGYALPLLKLTSIQLKYDSGSTDQQPNSGTQPTDERTLIRKLVTKPLDFVTSTVTKMAPFLFYSLSFLETFYQQDTLTNISLSNNSDTLMPPSPPKVLFFNFYFLLRNLIFSNSTRLKLHLAAKFFIALYCVA